MSVVGGLIDLRLFLRVVLGWAGAVVYILLSFLLPFCCFGPGWFLVLLLARGGGVLGLVVRGCLLPCLA
jgi:hypothetical protein